MNEEIKWDIIDLVIEMEAFFIPKSIKQYVIGKWQTLQRKCPQF